MKDIVENSDSIIETLKTSIDHSVVKIEKFEDMFSYDIEDCNKWFTGNDHEINIPLGIKGADTVVSMILGKGGGSTEHHVLIAGQTGAGKTTLLHTLIMSTLLQYSPEDVQMYLVDFKEGVEFKPYTKYHLPSLRVVAIDSEREFGLNILNELCSELEYRADIFAREDVEDINDYNDKPYVEKVPKLLLIFDEVQELFRTKDGNDRIASESLSAINKLVTQGRAMGIHLILACQDFSHCQGLQAYFSQMAVRIAVKGSEESAASILNSDNDGVRTLQNQPAGSAIYNRGGGVESANTFFQVSYMNKDERLHVLLVGMCGNDKSVPPLRPAHSQLIADTVCLLRGNLARIEGLSYLIAQHIIFFLLFPARHSGIAGLCQKELVRHGGRITFISGDILSAFCFLRVLAIVQTIPDSLSNRFAFARMAL